MGLEWADLDPRTWGRQVKSGLRKNFGFLGEESESTKNQRAKLEEQGAASADFANLGEKGFGEISAEAKATRDALRRLASGEDSLSREQLRQGVQQNVSAQRSMAASAAPQNQTGAALAAMRNAARLGSGMAGQAAEAGIRERAAATQALASMQESEMRARLQAALEARRNALAGYGGYKPEGTFLDKYGPSIMGGAQIAAQALSDERAKEDIVELDDKDARKVLDGLKGFTYRYKDEKHGKGRQIGPMAQGLEKAGLGHAVSDEREGKMVHGPKLALSVAALAGALHRRVSKLEGKGKE